LKRRGELLRALEGVDVLRESARRSGNRSGRGNDPTAADQEAGE